MNILTGSQTDPAAEYVPLADYRELEASLPLSTNRTRELARELLGDVLSHSDGDGSHGCVEVTNAINVIDTLIGDREALAAENDRLIGLIQRAMVFGVNGARLYSAREACQTGEEMKAVLRNVANARVRRSIVLTNAEDERITNNSGEGYEI